MFENKGVEGGFQELWNRFLSLFYKGKDEVVRTSKVSKARLDLTSLKRERERVFERLGEEIYKRRKENAILLPGLDPFFTEIDIINLKLSSKERELKELSGQEFGVVPPVPTVSQDAERKRERGERPHRPRRKGPPPQGVKQEMAPSLPEGVKTERPGADERPRKRYYRPRKRPSGVKQDVKIESSGGNKGL